MDIVNKLSLYLTILNSIITNMKTLSSVKNDSTAERVINSIRIIDDDLNERQPAR